MRNINTLQHQPYREAPCGVLCGLAEPSIHLPACLSVRPPTHLSEHFRLCLAAGSRVSPRQQVSAIDLATILSPPIRMNLAPTVGYEDDAGSRTTHHFMYPESARNLAANVSFVLVPFKTLDLLWITSALSTGHIRL